MIANTAVKPASSPAFRVGDERLIKLTENAARKVGSLLTKQGRPKGVLRVAVVGGGCSGLQYKMDLQDGPANRDILVETTGVRVVVDPPERERRGRAAYELARERYSWPALVRGVARVYDDVRAHRPARGDEPAALPDLEGADP